MKPCILSQSESELAAIDLLLGPLRRVPLQAWGV